MFVPNLNCRYKKRIGLDMYGAATYGPWVRAQCGLVRLEQDSMKTSVRTDSSASRGSAKEEIIIARILFPINVNLSQGDVVEASGFEMVVQSLWPRYSVAGELDHWQVDLEAKAN